MQPFGKHPDMIVQGERPLNLEAPLGTLRRSFVTPAALFYVRSHGTIPEVELHSYHLTISGARPLMVKMQT